MKTAWYVWNPDLSNAVSRHQTEADARARAEELARATPKHTYFVMQLVGMAKVVDVEYTRIIT